MPFSHIFQIIARIIRYVNVRLLLVSSRELLRVKLRATDSCLIVKTDLLRDNLATAQREVYVSRVSIHETAARSVDDDD